MRKRVAFAIIPILTLIILMLSTSCDRRIQVNDFSITTATTKIITKYNLPSSIETYIIRPNLNFDVVIPSTVDDKTIFTELKNTIDFVAIYDTLKEKYNTYFTDININIFDKNNKLIKQYSSSYYKSGTTIYDDDSKNEIDNFATWITSEN